MTLGTKALKGKWLQVISTKHNEQKENRLGSNGTDEELRMIKYSQPLNLSLKEITLCKCLTIFHIYYYPHHPLAFNST